MAIPVFPFPENYDPSICRLLPVPIALVPILGGALEQLEWEASWETEDDWELGRQAIIELEENLMSNNCIVDVHLHGWDGEDWRKLGLLWSYSDSLHGATGNPNCVAGTNEVYSSTVPAGEVWVIHTTMMLWVGGSCSSLVLRVGPSGSEYDADSYPSPASGLARYTRDTFVLKAGDRLRMTAYGLTAGDDIYFQWHGYKMQTDQ